MIGVYSLTAPGESSVKSDVLSRQTGVCSWSVDKSFPSRLLLVPCVSVRFWKKFPSLERTAVIRWGPPQSNTRHLNFDTRAKSLFSNNVTLLGSRGLNLPLEVTIFPPREGSLSTLHLRRGTRVYKIRVLCEGSVPAQALRYDGVSCLNMWSQTYLKEHRSKDSKHGVSCTEYLPGRYEYHKHNYLHAAPLPPMEKENLGSFLAGLQERKTPEIEPPLATNLWVWIPGLDTVVFNLLNAVTF